MLTEVRIRNFKCIKDVTIPLSPLTAFIGYHDTGKSSILQAIWLLSNFAEPRDPDWELVQKMLGVDKKIAEKLLFKFEGELKPKESLGSVIGKRKEVDSAVITEQFRERGPFYRYMGMYEKGGALISFLPARLKKPSYVEDYPPILKSDGSNLPSVLASMQGDDREGFLKIEQLLTQLVPTIRRILLRRCPVEREEREVITVDETKVIRYVKRTYWGDCLWFETATGDKVPAQAISDGTILLLGYLTALMAPPQPYLLLIDGPEEGIHPRALEKLVGFFRQMQQENPELQILMASHSPDLLSYLKPEEIVIVRRGEDGYTEAARLDQLPDVEEWLKGMTPGELWLLSGEDELIARIKERLGR